MTSTSAAGPFFIFAEGDATITADEIGERLPSYADIVGTLRTRSGGLGFVIQALRLGDAQHLRAALDIHLTSAIGPFGSLRDMYADEHFRGLVSDPTAGEPASAREMPERFIFAFGSPPTVVTEIDECLAGVDARRVRTWVTAAGGPGALLVCAGNGAASIVRTRLNDALVGVAGPFATEEALLASKAFVLSVPDPQANELAAV